MEPLRGAPNGAPLCTSKRAIYCNQLPYGHDMLDTVKTNGRGERTVQNEVRTVYYDSQLQVEAYRFQGVMQKFPNHFHDYYVVGFIEAGQRYLLCNNQEYIINPGDITLFNPRDVHSCQQVDGSPLDYRCLNISVEAMKKAALEITGTEFEPKFCQPVLFRSELAGSLQELHRMISEGEADFVKEEFYLFLLGHLIQEYASQPPDCLSQEHPQEFQQVCAYLEQHYVATVSLEELSALAGMSKYHFLRSFTRQRGISPYSYLQTIRIGNAKKLLEQGVSPVEVALRTGFSDQSHFSNFFKKLIGLTPRQYMRIFSAQAQA